MFVARRDNTATVAFSFEKYEHFLVESVRKFPELYDSARTQYNEI